MVKIKNTVLLSISGIGIISICSSFIFVNFDDVARLVRNPLDTEIKVIRNSEGNLAVLVIPEGAYQDEGFHVPEEIPHEALLQVGMNIQSRGANSFRIAEETVYKAHFHTPIDNPRREMFIIKEGVVKLTFYSKDGQAVQEKILYPGDVAFITQGHSVEFLTDCKVIEIKEGPYPGTPEGDKIWLEARGKPSQDGLNFTEIATVSGPDNTFLGAVFNSRVNEFIPTINIPIEIKQENGAQIVRWRNNGYEMVHVRTGNLTINLLIDGEVKQIELHQGDTILLLPKWD